ncbi:MAG: HAMP domain-containing histidine kinase [Anaerolineales bacterium]|nr:HAMP domain-containing histidine kinase [Anaerolineales bacterium]
MTGSFLKRQIEDKKQILKIVLPEKLSLMWADRMRVIQVLVNYSATLINIRRKAAPADCRGSANQWDAEGAARVIHLWVKDDGLGMSPEDQERCSRNFSALTIQKR